MCPRQRNPKQLLLHKEMTREPGSGEGQACLCIATHLIPARPGGSARGGRTALGEEASETTNCPIRSRGWRIKWGVCASAHIHTDIYTHMHTDVYTHAYTHPRTYAYIYAYTHAHVHMHTCMYLCTYTELVLHRHIHAHIYIHRASITHTHTYTHTELA